MKTTKQNKINTYTKKSSKNDNKYDESELNQ